MCRAVVDHRQRVLLPRKVVDRYIGPTVEHFEGIEQVEPEILRRLAKSAGCGIRVEILWLHVEDAGCRLEFRLVNRLLERS